MEHAHPVGVAQSPLEGKQAREDLLEGGNTSGDRKGPEGDEQRRRHRRAQRKRPLGEGSIDRQKVAGQVVGDEGGHVIQVDVLEVEQHREEKGALGI